MALEPNRMVLYEWSEAGTRIIEDRSDASPGSLVVEVGTFSDPIPIPVMSDAENTEIKELIDRLEAITHYPSGIPVNPEVIEGLRKRIIQSGGRMSDLAALSVPNCGKVLWGILCDAGLLIDGHGPIWARRRSEEYFEEIKKNKESRARSIIDERMSKIPSWIEKEQKKIKRSKSLIANWKKELRSLTPTKRSP